MAQTSSRTNQETFGVLGILSVLLLVQTAHAFEFKVGGSSSWKVPSDPHTAIYNHWAEKNRFQIGDSLLFVYSADQDSVLHVTKDDYTNCNTEAPLDKFTDGHTVFTFNQSGPHYFISGVVDHCRKYQKLQVTVMADRSKHDSNETVASPPPSPSEDVLPPASPAPSGEESPSPPPSINPTPAPSEESAPPKNGASSIVTSFVGTMAAFVGSSLVLAI